MEKQKTIITVLGAGNMGTALTQVLTDNKNNEVRIWNWEGDRKPLKEIEKYRENKLYLKGIKLSKRIKVFYSLEEALKNSEIIFLVVPSSAIKETVKKVNKFLNKKTIIVDCSKGIDKNNLKIITDVIKDNLDKNFKNNVYSISGPAVALQMVKKNLTMMNLSGRNTKDRKKIKKTLENDYLKIIEIEDLIGLEIAGSFKNAYTIAIGLCDGFDFSLNSKAIVFTFAIKEISEVIKKMGGKKETIFELAGIGDLLATAFAKESRNRRFGENLAKELNKEKALKKVGQTVEGIEAVNCLKIISKKYKIKLPLNDMVYKCLNNDKQTKKIFFDFFKNNKF